jgi:hypothetical protein
MSKEFSKKELLEEAKRRYPVGTYFKSFEKKDQVREVKPYKRGSDITWYWSEELKGSVIRSLSGLYTEDIHRERACSNPCVYKDGKWAEIVSKPESVEKMEEPKFIVGKWYKRTTKPTSNTFVLYIKCFSINPIKDCEHITFGGKHNVILTQGRGYKEWKALEDLSEIQQYLPEGHPDKFPVSKELTSLPEKWCIAVTEESYFVLSEWRDAGGLGNVSGYCLSYYQNSKGWWVESKSPSEWPEYTEITLDQFKRWILKESSEVSLVGRYLKALVDRPQNTSFKKGDYVKILSKADGNKYAIEGAWAYTTNNSTAYQWELMPEGFTPPLTVPTPPSSSSEIPEYVKCMECYGRAIKGKIYDTSNLETDILNGLSWESVLIEFRNLGRFFKPSTKEAYEAQQKPQTMVQKWAVGTYVVFLKNYGDNPKGTVDRIGKDFGETIQAATKYIFHDSSSLCNLNKNTEVKWFATEKEAEEFAKTLREPEPAKPSVEPEWTPQVGEWVVDSLNIPFKLTHSTGFSWYGTKADGSSYSEASLYIRKALPHEIPSERGSGIIQQIESVKDYEVLTEEELREIVSDLVYTPSEPSSKVDTALSMISFVIPPREI